MKPFNLLPSKAVVYLLLCNQCTELKLKGLTTRFTEARGKSLFVRLAETSYYLQANPAQPETWYVPHAKRGTDLDASDSSLQVLALRVSWIVSWIRRLVLS